MPKFKCNFHLKTFLVVMLACLMVSNFVWAGKCKKKNYWTDEFNLSGCTFSDTGSNAYFSLIPGTEILLEGEEDGELVQVRITVTGDTLEVDGVTTRVIFEEEWIDGELVEESWNWFARCEETGDIYYFGEDVNIYEDGDISHDGAWKAGEDDATPGIIMPGSFLLGSRYYQEIAPDVALDRAEHIESGLTVETPADTYTDCVKVLETTPLECSAKDIKIYAPGVGLIVDAELERVSEFTEFD